MNDFDAIAPIYDQLKNLVFWGRLEQAKKTFLNRISPHTNILIIGGGSGQVLKYLDELGLPLKVDYIEPSGKMIRKAKSRELVHLNVTWFQQSVLEFETNQTYDIIIANFIFDLFEEENLSSLLSQTKHWLKSEGQLLVADFQIKKSWHLWLSRCMHLFFKKISDLESQNLKELDADIRKAGFSRQSSKEYYGTFVFSSVYKVKL